MSTTSRRELIRLIAAGALGVPGLCAAGQAFSAVQRAAATGHRVVLVELSGANDGLNTLVPRRNDAYFKLRPTLALQQPDRIDLDTEWSVHKALRPLLPLWERAELAIVQGLGYPAPVRSHFKSIALWESGGDGRRSGRDGWLTHDVEHRLGRQVADAHGISLGGTDDLFHSPTGRWVSMKTANTFARLRAPAAHSAAAPDNPVLAMIARRSATLETMLDSIGKKITDGPALHKLPGGELGRQLSQVLQLVRAGVDTPVYRVQLSGFDTHEKQAGRHAALLDQLSIALNSFAEALREDGEWDRTLVMTYSEFGRRAAENISGGTDHGTAAPHLVVGGTVRGALIGTPPDLSVLRDGDPDFTLDYRALYERVLGDWFAITDNRYQRYRHTVLDTLLA